MRESSLHHFKKLVVLGGCLSLTDFKEDDRAVCGVWVMKDYGVKESWTKEFEVRQSSELQPLKFTQGKLFMTEPYSLIA